MEERNGEGGGGGRGSRGCMGGDNHRHRSRTQQQQTHRINGAVAIIRRSSHFATASAQPICWQRVVWPLTSSPVDVDAWAGLGSFTAANSPTPLQQKRSA